MSDSPRGSAAWTTDPQSYVESRPPTHAVPEKPRSFYLTMRDGVRLAVDIHLPQGERTETGFPAVMIFTPGVGIRPSTSLTSLCSSSVWLVRTGSHIGFCLICQSRRRPNM